MSINAKNLDRIDGVRFTDITSISYDVLSEGMVEEAEKYGIKLETTKDTIESGSFFNPIETNCLCIYHPDHYSDYFRYYLTAETQGSTCLVTLYMGGKSKQMGKEAFSQNVKIFDGSGAMSTSAGLFKGGTVGVGFAIGAGAVGIAKAGVKGIAKGINALTMNKSALEEEKKWYALVNEILGAIFE